MRFNELTSQPEKDDGSLPIIKAFVDFACDRIGLERPPKIKLIRDPKLASSRRSFGGYMPGGGIEITIGNRHIMDVLRTLAHEMVHHKQDVDGRLHDESGKDGSEHENEANAKAAVVMRLWGKMNPDLFQRAAILAEGQIKKSSKKSEDYHPNDKPLGPEFKPTMPAGTVKVDVTDVYDWYKLGQHVSDLKGLGKHDFGKGPPSAIMAFGSEDEEHKYIKALKKTGLDTTDIDPVDTKQPKNMPRQKVDPTYNVDEARKRKRKPKGAAYGPYGWYGYDAGYSGDSGGGDGGGGESIENENFADGKNPGRKGLSKRVGVDTKASVSTLRNVAKNSSGEKQRMAHWMANMKAGKAKKK